MGKSIHFYGQPIFGQLIKLLGKDKILQLSRQHGGERYVKSFDGYAHLLTMLYAVILRCDSLREIEAAMCGEYRKLHHLGIEKGPSRSTLSDANARRSEEFFRSVYFYLYEKVRDCLSADSRVLNTWLKSLKIIDSTTITLSSNIVLKGTGQFPKKGKRKGGIKVHTVICANENVPCDVEFTPSATFDSMMLYPSRFVKDEILAMDRAYIDYDKFEELTVRGVTYVTKMKKNLKYEVLEDTMRMNLAGKMEYREQKVLFRKGSIRHRARIVTYVDTKNVKRPKLTQLLTNDFDMPVEDIVDIYRRRWQIESFFKQIKQNFPLRYFYGESVNAIKIQIWVTLIANLLISYLRSGLVRSWSFSGLATMLRIVLMYYLNMYSFFDKPEEDMRLMLREASESPPGMGGEG